MITNLNAKSSVILEIVATIFFFKRDGYTDESLINEKIRILKPSLEDKLEEAFTIYRKLIKTN